MQHTERIGVYPGTFDPITHGHCDIITRALRVVDRLIIGVAQDTGKSPLLDLDTRVQLVKDDVHARIEGADTRIEVYGFSGLLVEFAQTHRATLLIRGLRAVSDFEYEFQMASINSKLHASLETVFLTASESTHFISSRFVKQICKLGGDVRPFVSEQVAHYLEQMLQEV